MNDLDGQSGRGPAEPASRVFEAEATVGAWDQDYYHPVAVRYYDRAIPWMLDAMGAGPGDEVLDAGCGPGVHAIRAARHGCRVTAIDFSSAMLAHARERASQAGVGERIDFVQADLTALDLGRSFRHVFSWGVLIHVPEIERALDRLTGTVAPGGTLALQVLSRGSLDFRAESLVRRLLGRPLPDRSDSAFGTGNWYDYHGGRLWVMRFDVGGLDRALGERGFRRTARRAAEYTELQWRLPDPLRALLLHGNTLAHRTGAPAGLSATQILIYRKMG